MTSYNDVVIARVDPDEFQVDIRKINSIQSYNNEYAMWLRDRLKAQGIQLAPRPRSITPITLEDLTEMITKGSGLRTVIDRKLDYIEVRQWHESKLDKIMRRGFERIDDAVNQIINGRRPEYADEGSPCPHCFLGTLQYREVEECYCHIAPPCKNCVENPLICSDCDWE